MTELNLIRYIVKFLIPKDLIHTFFESVGISYKKSYNYEKLSLCLNDLNRPTLNQLNYFIRSYWVEQPVDFHYSVLTSGAIEGHSWHYARPSSLHLSFQDKVRAFIESRSDIESLFTISKDVMKQEYYMVAIHDLTEAAIINSNANAIPSIRKRSVSDFVLNGIPFDLKVTNFLVDFDTHSPSEICFNLFDGADSLRQREQYIEDDTLNRLYVVVKNQAEWLTNPKLVVDKIIESVNSLGSPISFKREGRTILAYAIIV